MSAQPLQQLSLASGEVTLPLPSLPTGSCLRAISAHQGFLELVLLDLQGNQVTSDTGIDFALLDPDGPLCLRGTEGFKLRLRGHGEAWLQLWSAAPGG
jgi:hypothetical protein